MEINWLWVLIVGGLWLVRYLVKNSQGQSLTTAPPTQQFTATLSEDSIRISDGTPMDIMRIYVLGSITVPTDQHPCTMQISLWDVTDPGQRHPILTPLQDHQGPNGQFQVQHDLVIPYQQSTINNMLVCTVPVGLLRAARRGRRTVEVTVMIGPQGYPSNFYRRSAVYFNYQENKIGYLEMRDHVKNSESAIAGLAVAFAAADGDVADAEVHVINHFFSDRYADTSDAQHIAQGVAAEIKVVLERMKNNASDAAAEIARHVAFLKEHADESALQVAYELCLTVITADDVLAAAELERLNELSQQLGLSSDFVKEVNDRYLRVSMYQTDADADAVGMPAGLDREQQKAYLAEEYRKWRGRTTHKDPTIAAEASMRLEKIAHLRSRLDEADR